MEFGGGGLLGEVMGLADGFEEAAGGETHFDIFHIGVRELEELLDRSFDPFVFRFGLFSVIAWAAHFINMSALT